MYLLLREDYVTYVLSTLLLQINNFFSFLIVFKINLVIWKFFQHIDSKFYFAFFCYKFVFRQKVLMVFELVCKFETSCQ